MTTRKRLTKSFFLWILCHSCLTRPSHSSHHTIKRRSDHLSSRLFPHFYDSHLMEDISASDDQDSLFSSDDSESDGQEEVFLSDASPPSALSRHRASPSHGLLILNQDQAVEQSIDSNSYQPARDMTDDLLDRGSSRAESRFPTSTTHSGEDLFAAAGRHYRASQDGHQGFFQYARQPAKGAWEFGYRRGNNEHFTERHEHGASHHVKAKVRWGDRHGGYGEHYFDYNHKGIGEEMPSPRPRHPQPRQRHYNRYAASEVIPVRQEWPE